MKFNSLVFSGLVVLVTAFSLLAFNVAWGLPQEGLQALYKGHTSCPGVGTHDLSAWVESKAVSEDGKYELMVVLTFDVGDREYKDKLAAAKSFIKREPNWEIAYRLAMGKYKFLLVYDSSNSSSKSSEEVMSPPTYEFGKVSIPVKVTQARLECVMNPALVKNEPEKYKPELFNFIKQSSVQAGIIPELTEPIFVLFWKINSKKNLTIYPPRTNE